MAKKPLTEAEKEARKEALAAESKSDRFVRLAQPRVSAVILAIRKLPTLAASSYESTPEQRAAMFRAIREELSKAEAQFQPREKKGDGPAFQF